MIDEAKPCEGPDCDDSELYGDIRFLNGFGWTFNVTDDDDDDDASYTSEETICIDEVNPQPRDEDTPDDDEGSDVNDDCASDDNDSNTDEGNEDASNHTHRHVTHAYTLTTVEENPQPRDEDTSYDHESTYDDSNTEEENDDLSHHKHTSTTKVVSEPQSSFDICVFYVNSEEPGESSGNKGVNDPTDNSPSTEATVNKTVTTEAINSSGSSTAKMRVISEEPGANTSNTEAGNAATESATTTV